MTEPARSEDMTSISGGDMPSTLSTWVAKFQRNTSKAFEDLQPRAKIRLVVIICAYFLLRPYLVKIGAWLQMRDLERQNQRAEFDASSSDVTNGEPQPRVAIPGVNPEDEERDEAEAYNSASHWGRRAKIRQRAMFRQKLDEHEARLREMQEAESDQDIADLLED